MEKTGAIHPLGNSPFHCVRYTTVSLLYYIPFVHKLVTLGAVTLHNSLFPTGLLPLYKPVFMSITPIVYFPDRSEVPVESRWDVVGPYIVVVPLHSDHTRSVLQLEKVRRDYHISSWSSYKLRLTLEEFPLTDSPLLY